MEDQATKYLTKNIFEFIKNTLYVIDNKKCTFKIFDGDIDPVWAENVNSVLDDIRLFTLSNGGRKKIPKNLQFVSEVQDLKYTTNATVSRCGLSNYSNKYVSAEILWYNFMLKILSDQSKKADLKWDALNRIIYDRNNIDQQGHHLRNVLARLFLLANLEYRRAGGQGVQSGREEFKDEDIMVWQNIRALNMLYNMLSAYVVQVLRKFSEKELAVGEAIELMHRVRYRSCRGRSAHRSKSKSARKYWTASRSKDRSSSNPVSRTQT
eukprot:Mrub_04665.p1 GENE.Mrub_04665~~Mrub_04665.p1  ORF type:complete len:266 (+),score=46.95 Mrub_04665:75-872(+)